MYLEGNVKNGCLRIYGCFTCNEHPNETSSPVMWNVWIWDWTSCSTLEESLKTYCNCHIVFFNLIKEFKYYKNVGVTWEAGWVSVTIGFQLLWNIWAEVRTWCCRHAHRTPKMFDWLCIKKKKMLYVLNQICLHKTSDLLCVAGSSFFKS